MRNSLRSLLVWLPFCIGLAMSTGGALPLGAQEPPRKEPNILLETVQIHANRLARVASDSHSLELYRTHLSSTLGLQDTLPLMVKRPSRRGKNASVAPPELSGPAIRLTNELAAWQVALALRQAVAEDKPGELDAVLGNVAPRRAWLLEGSQRSHLNQAIILGQALNSFQTNRELAVSPPAGFSEFAERLDRSYSLLQGQEGSWLSLVEQEGEDGIRRRMREALAQIPETETAEEEVFSLYFASRLRPVLAANMTGLSIRAETEAEQHARQMWRELQSWQENWNKKKGLARLCGTWSWTLHNHQNHQDHKMVLTFSHPDAPSPSGPTPSEVVVLGDAVYLRWDFPRGYQEDSLLFSPEGHRLEGTFRNSNGPWGSIAGKRASPCQSSPASPGNSNP